MRGALRIDEPVGERWDLALDLLQNGESAVSTGVLNLFRSTNGPSAERRLRVEIRASSSSPDLARAEADVAAGLAQLDALLGDDRFAAIADKWGVAIEYVDDYDTGRIALARITPHRSILWFSDLKPST